MLKLIDQSAIRNRALSKTVIVLEGFGEAEA